MDMRPVLFIDAFNLFSRHYVRHPGMSSLGHQAGGIVGFMDALRKLTELVVPSAIFIIWEGGGSLRRRAIFPEYKANRRPPKLNRYYEDDIPDSNENRLYQVKTLIALLNHVPVCQIFVEDCEADDVIGYLCRNRFRDEKKLIASSDRDFYQLVDENTMIYSWATKKFMGPSEVLDEFNISAENFVLAKAVCGDPSDSIPGVRGVGFKILAKRFDLRGSQLTISDLMTMCDEARAQSNVKIYTQIYENHDLIKRNWKLMYLDVGNLAALQVRKIDAIIDSYKPTKNKIKLMRMLLDEGLGSYDSHEFFSAFSAV